MVRLCQECKEVTVSKSNQQTPDSSGWMQCGREYTFKHINFSLEARKEHLVYHTIDCAVIPLCWYGFRTYLLRSHRAEDLVWQSLYMNSFAITFDSTAGRTDVVRICAVALLSGGESS